MLVPTPTPALPDLVSYDRVALEALYNDTGGPEWTNNRELVEWPTPE